jgi:hypothetical protein
MKTKLFTLCFSLFTVSLIFACSCDPNGNFSKVAPKTNLVVLVKINKYLTFQEFENDKIPMSMEVEIIEILKGRIQNKKIIVWGDNGILCRPYLTTFNEGEYYFLALYSTGNMMRQKEEKKTHYFVSVCGEYWMKANMDKKIALSNYMDKKKQISFNKILRQFK